MKIIRSRLKTKFGSLAMAAVAACSMSLYSAAPAPRIAGSGFGGASPYATDAYPGFDGLDDLKTPEKREKSWFLGVSRDTPSAQWAYVQEMEAAGEYRAARRGCDALVREWPSSPEAPKAQLRLADIWVKYYQDWEEAFEALDYMLNFYSGYANYLELVERQYEYTNKIVEERKSFLGFAIVSTRVIRQHYEAIVRRAPGASYVPEAMLKIADLREKDYQYEEAVQVYGALMAKYPVTAAVKTAVYRQAKARMWLARRLAYNTPRCLDTLNYLKMMIVKHPDLPEIEEMKKWESELSAYLEKDAYEDALFYDSKQRTRHASIAAWKRYLEEHPTSVHAEEIKARIANLEAAAAKAASPSKEQ